MTVIDATKRAGGGHRTAVAGQCTGDAGPKNPAFSSIAGTLAHMHRTPEKICMHNSIRPQADLDGPMRLAIRRPGLPVASLCIADLV